MRDEQREIIETAIRRLDESNALLLGLPVMIDRNDITIAKEHIVDAVLRLQTRLRTLEKGETFPFEQKSMKACVGKDSH